MASSQLMADYRQWLVFQRQEQLSREHQGIAQRLEDARASANQVVQAYRSMAEKAAAEGACYRTLFLRERDNASLPCEGWLFVRRVLSEGNSTRVRATLLETFTLEDGIVAPGEKPANKLTLEIYDKLEIDKGMRTQVRVDCLDNPEDFHFITLLDAVRGDLRPHLK
ncbi:MULTISPECIES: hypothetical protein [Halomonadaceae]|jgi:hypothetical protein|uniref:Uncharacterized protein n=1 Tax=Vreelandella piezotolerans TaxID=2609667 RepID=A0ABQ6X731_9GAMM|nr:MULTISPECIES: hypothetical protein [Halomonas]KAE8437230.1 hypothetical protein F1978_15350 [Halomonas piezotolerans]MCG7578406.1 hypothetical protein [Halomonas sp. MMH1-48]MCG7591198.1 hypothetical protein [Halomonas sp. McD50-5]MCG7605519.1 hypothetical protein [Halomonas sp. MM17-34]MCG7614684.1 hypothetical protein [Halomonas sp. MM17-29]